MVFLPFLKYLLNIDLSTIEKRLTSRLYKKLAEFLYDMNKIFDNCRIYNKEDTIYYAYAEKLEGFFLSKIKVFKEDMKVSYERHD